MRKSTVLFLAALSLAPFAQAQNTLAGNLTVQQTVKLTGAVSPAQITSSVNDYAPAGFSTAAVLRLQSDVPRTITGLAGGVAGRMVWLTNIGSQTISLATESASSTAANRFAFGASGFDLPAGGSLSIWYDTTSSRWRSATNLAAGGGGTTVDQTARDAAAAAQATADSKQAALANAGTLAKVTEAAGLPLWDGAAWPGGGSGGTGTVTSVSVVTANGVSGSVATATTTPAITLSLGAITPASVAAAGAVTGSNLSGTNTGDQTSVSGNAGTATKLATARAINGVSFDGTAAITVPAAAGTLTGATLASGVTASSLTSAAGGTFGTAAFTPSTAYEVPVTFTAPLFRVANTVSIPAATSSTGGYLTSADWSTFNGKSNFSGAYSALSGTPSTFAPSAHALDGVSHSVSGLTAGQFLKATGATTFGFAPHGLTYSDVGADAAGAAAAITLAGLGGVPTSRTVNGHALSSNVTVTPSDLSLAIGTNTQAWSAKLDAVAALAAGSGWLHNDGAGALAWSMPSKSDVGLGSVENAAISTWAGSTNLATVGTITSGTWHGSALADTYVSSAATWNAKVSFPGFGTTGTTAAVGNDARLSDARTPTAHNQAWSTITSTPTTISGYGITDAQGLDSDLTALATNSTNGLWARTGAGTGSARTITGSANQVTVTNGDGVSGNPTLSLPQSISTASTPQFAGMSIGTASQKEKLDVGGAVVVRGQQVSYSTESSASVLDYAGSTRLLSFGDASTGGSFSFYSARANNVNGGTLLVISQYGALRLITYGAGTLITDSSGNVTASSDRRLKNVSGKFSRGLDAILQIQPKVFTWKPGSGMNPDDINVGFIAQDVQPAIPEAVGSMKTVDTEEDDGTGKKVKKQKREASEFLTLSDRPIIAALVNAVKELKAENDAILARVSALENGKATK